MKPPPPLAQSPLISHWLRFGAKRRVTLLTGRVELGQGALTSILQMAAAELGLSPAQIEFVSGDTATTPNEGFTAGSMSIAQGGMAARWAASAARNLALAEAALRLNTEKAALTVRGGQVYDQETATKFDLRDICTTLDLDKPVVDHAQPLAADGQPALDQPRIDLPARVFGTPFAQDMGEAGLLHGRMLHPPAFGGRLIRADEDTLRLRPGVVEVFRDGSALGVIAKTRLQADAAIEFAALSAEWSEPEGLKSNLRAQLRAETNQPGETVHAQGNRATVAGEESFELVATRGYLSHGSIGPSAALALWHDGRLELRSHSQGVFALRDAVATVLGLSLEDIRVTHVPGAGCYGHNGADDAALDAALLARMVPGKWVRVIWSRTDEFRASPLGAAMATRIRATLAHGKVTSAEVMVASPPHGNRPGSGGAPQLLTAMQLARPFAPARSPDLPPARGGGADRNAVPLYDIPALHVSKRLLHDLPFRASSLRSLGAHLNVFAIEMMMEEAAARVGCDPIAFRLDHLSDPRARAVIETASEGLQLSDEGAAWGLGFARYKNSAAYAAVALRLEMGDALCVTHARVAVDTGEIVNRDGVLNQIEGGLLQAISWTLKEEVPISGSRVAVDGWPDYPILTFSEVPEADIRLIERPGDPPLGCGEVMAGPTAAAIGAAAARLLGQRVIDLPLTETNLRTALA